MELKPQDERYLRIFLISLAFSKSSLPTKVQKELNKVGLDFVDDPFTCIDNLWEIGHYDCLQEFYKKATKEIRMLERDQERSKFGLPEGFSGEEQTTEISNTSIRSNVGELAVAVELIDFLFPLKPIEIFIASDSVTETNSYIEKVRVNIENVKNQVSNEIYQVSSAEILNIAPLIYE